MKSIPKLPTGVRLGAVALACVVVAEVTSVLAHATVPARNSQIVFRKALGHPARLAIVNADGTGYRMLPRAKVCTTATRTGHVTDRRSHSSAARCVEGIAWSDPLQGTGQERPRQPLHDQPGWERLKQLTDYPGNVVSTGSFSPDGKWITFARSASVFVMRTDGTGAREVTHGVSAWSPDGGPAR